MSVSKKEKEEIKKVVELACAALSEKKADDIKVIDISGISVIADYYIITNGENPNQVHALVDNVEEVLGRAGFTPKSIEGYGAANWVLMDYVDVVINVFSREDRRFYDLERIWRDGKVVEFDQTREN